MITIFASLKPNPSSPSVLCRSDSNVPGCAAKNDCIISHLCVLTEALADLQEMLEVPEPPNSSPEGATVQGPESCGEVMTALRFCMLDPYKISRRKAGKLAGGQRSSAREASSQEVNNNSKQSSTKRGPPDVLTLQSIVHPKGPCGKYTGACYI